MRWRLRAAAFVLAAGIGSHDANAAGPRIFDCRADDGHCPEVSVAGDPPAQIAGYGPAPFRGFGDPSLRHDPQTGALWLAYSWVSILVAPTSRPGTPILDIGVGIHLARSDDGGRTYRHVTNLWTSDRETYEDQEGYSGHEVVTISPVGAGWAALALRYFNPQGNGNDFKPDSFHFELVEGANPEQLPTARAVRLGGPLTSGAWRPFVDLSEVAGVGIACPVWTEPTLFEDADTLYLLAQCKTPRNPADGFLGLFARRAAGWRWVGRLAAHSEAASLGGNELTQADLARTRDGGLVLIVTPNIVHGRDEHHLGCAVLPIASLDPPQLMRDAAGAPIVRARIISSDSVQNGPGACAYDSGSMTGILIVRRTFSPAKGVIFSIHATGMHP